MAKKRNLKENGEESDRSCRESSSDGSVLENPINSGTKNSNRSRKCKVPVSNKTSSDLKVKRRPRSKGISESSCDSVAKEVSECSLAKEAEEVNPIENNFQEPMNIGSKTKRKYAKINDEESDRSCRESSSERSVIENSIDNGKKNRSRKCRVQNTDKKNNISKGITSPKSKDGRSSDSLKKGDSESNIAKQSREMSPSDENKVTSPQSVDPIENNSEEPLPDDKEDQIKINNDKYSELLSILGGKEGDIDSFIKQFSIWKQSQSVTGKQLKNKKNAKPQKLQTTMKSKVPRGMPAIKLNNKASSKKLNKFSNKKSSLHRRNDLKQPDHSIPENKINNSDSSSTLGQESISTEVKIGDLDEGIGRSSDTNRETKTEDENSKVTAEDNSDCHKDAHTDLRAGTVHSKGKTKSDSNHNKRGKRNLEVISEEEIPDCRSTLDTHAKDGEIDTESEKNRSKEIKVSDVGGDLYITPEVMNIVNKIVDVSKSEGKSKNEECNSIIVKSQGDNSNVTKRGKRKAQELPKEEISECPSTIATHVKVGEMDSKDTSENPDNTKPDNCGSKEIEESNGRDTIIIPEITSIVNKIDDVSKSEGKSKNEEINSVIAKSLGDNSSAEKRIKRKVQELSKEEISECPSTIATHVKVSEMDFKESSKHPNHNKPEYSRSKEIKVSHEEDPHVLPKITSIVNDVDQSVSNGEGNSKGEDIEGVIVKSPRNSSNRIKCGKKKVGQSSKEDISVRLNTGVGEVDFKRKCKSQMITKSDNRDSKKEVEVPGKGGPHITPEITRNLNKIKGVTEGKEIDNLIVESSGEGSIVTKHVKRKDQELSKEDVSECLNTEVGEVDFNSRNNNQINTKSDNHGSKKDKKISDKGKLHISPEIVSNVNKLESVSEGEGNSKGKEIDKLIIKNEGDNKNASKRVKRNVQELLKENKSECLNTEVGEVNINRSCKNQMITKSDNPDSKNEVKVPGKGEPHFAKEITNNVNNIEGVTEGKEIDNLIVKIPEENSNIIKHVSRKVQELSKEDISDCLNTEVEFNRSCKNQINSKYDNCGSKIEVIAPHKNEPYLFPEVTTYINEVEISVLEDEGDGINEEINNVIVDTGNKDSVHEDDKISGIYVRDNLLDFPDSDNLLPETFHENDDMDNSISSDNSNDRVNESDGILSNNVSITDSFSEISVNDESNNLETNQSVNENSFDSIANGMLPYSKSKSQSCSSLPNIENYTLDDSNYFDHQNKEKTDEDICDTSAVLNLNNSPLILRDSEADTVWKRKRRMSDDNKKYAKRTKCGITMLDETFDDHHNDITSSDPLCNKWNSEEQNSFLEELIYSDEEKINNFSDKDVNHNVPKSTVEPISFKENHSHKIKNISSKFHLDDNIEKPNFVKSNRSHRDETFDNSSIHLKGTNSTENMMTPQRKLRKEWKEKKSSSSEVDGHSRKTKHRSKDKDNINKISSKSKKQMKSKVKSKSKKSKHRDDVQDHQIKDDYDNSYELMLKKVKKQLKKSHISVLETDLPIVEVSYKGEQLHGILGSMDSNDFMTSYKQRQEKRRNENILNSSYAQDLLKHSLRPLCPQMLREGSCKDSQKCRKEHKVHKDFFSVREKHDAWLIVAFILRISNCLSESLLTAILEFLSKYKAKRKILIVSRHIFQSQQHKFPVHKSFWEDIIIALECCGLQRCEGMRRVIQFIIDKHSSPKAEVFHQMLKIWKVHGSSFSNTWQIVEPLVTGKIISLQPLILSKLLGETIAVEPKDKVNIYRHLVRQLTSLTKDNFNQISYQLLNDFLRKISHEGLHSEEKLLRETMNVSYNCPFSPQQPPDHCNPSSLRRCISMIELTNTDSDSKFLVETTVHEEEKMEAAILRALQCSNYDSVVKVLIASLTKLFINKVLLVAFKYIFDKNSLVILKNIFVKIKTSFAQYADDVKDLVGHIVVTLMLVYVKQYNWKEANNYFNLLEESHVRKYNLKSLTDQNLCPVRLAVVYSEIHYYNGRYKESIGVFIDTSIIDPDTTQWAIPGGTEEDFRIIGVMVVFLLNELINKNIVNIATMLFKAVLEAQNSLTEPIDIGQFFEVLLYKLFELTEEYPETAVKLYTRVIAKDNNLTLYGLTYRALIILAYRTHKRSIIKDIFYKAINEYVYPIIEENENGIMLLRSFTEEEIIVYILEWVARYQEKQPDTHDYKIKIKFKEALLEDYLDNKDLGIPAPLKEVDQTLPGAFKRLASVLKRLNVKIKQIKKDTFSIDPSSFKNFLNKIKVY